MKRIHYKLSPLVDKPRQIPEKRLYTAVISQAIKDLVNENCNPNSKADAIMWLKNRHENKSPFIEYVNIISDSDAQKEYILNKIDKIINGQIKPIMTQFPKTRAQNKR